MRLAVGGALSGTGFLGAAFGGVQAAVIAVIVRSVHRIAGHILLDRYLWWAAAAAAAGSLAGADFWIVLPAVGGAYALASVGRPALACGVLVVAIVVAAALSVGSPGPVGGRAAAIATDASAAAVFWAGLKGGLLTFGGAYTAIPFVRDDTVGRGWITDAQFLDGLALSGIIPAPLVIFVTFVGWVVGGAAGALAITAEMFLPAFAFSLVLYERLEELVAHRRLQLFLAGAAAGVVGLILVTLVAVTEAAGARSPDLPVAIGVFAVALAVLYRWRSKLATPAVLLFGGIVGAVGMR